jgi:MoaA/NifB/PqqE/SkfB family radical SAM enzyme
MGNLRQQSFREIWQNGEYRQFRSRILKGRKEIDICANCSEGTRVWGD